MIFNENIFSKFVSKHNVTVDFHFGNFNSEIIITICHDGNGDSKSFDDDLKEVDGEPEPQNFHFEKEGRTDLASEVHTNGNDSGQVPLKSDEGRSDVSDTATSDLSLLPRRVRSAPRS